MRILFHSLLPVTLILALAACGGAEPPPVNPEQRTFADVSANSTLSEGLLDIYQEKSSGALFMRLSPEDLARDYLYFATFLDGNRASGAVRGIFASERVIRLEKRFDKLLFLQQNTGFYFNPDSALSRAADANVLPTVLAAAKIHETAENGDLLVDVTAVLLSEALQQIKPAADPQAEPGSRFMLGELSADKTTVERLRNYPENTDIIVNYVYEDPAPLVGAGASVTDDRFVSIVLQHSLIAAPEPGFQPRFEDPRVGFFSGRVTDMTSQEPTPYRDPIHRWKLVKKEPGAKLSDPVEPIVFWLENTTPEEHRDTIRDAVLTWNKAFESAGFSNAVEVRIQPDDADWDAADLRYNVLRWTSSPESPWSGYGPLWADPRSGQVLGADIMLEFRWLTSHVRRNEVFSQAMLALDTGEPGRGDSQCLLGSHMQSQVMLAHAAMAGRPGDGTREEIVRQALYDLVMHEVGHALGLNHNFRGSNLLTPAQLADPATTAERGVTASVMDYLAINFASPGEPQGNYYPLAPGPYDHWAISYGYSEALDDPAAEQQRLEALLGRSTEPPQAFGLDADVMYSSLSGIDPRVMMFDQSADPLAYANERLALVEDVAATLPDRFDQPGDSWQMTYNAFLALTSESASQLRVVSRWIGGIFVDRSLQGQPGATQPLVPVPAERQREAMRILAEHLFAPGAMSYDSRLYRHLQRQRRGQDDWYKPQDPKLHARTLAIQKTVLEHLLHPVVTARITDSTLYGNDYDLHRVMQDLTGAIYDADMAGAVNSMRVQLQREYTEMLLTIVDPDKGAEYDHVARAAALYNLQQIAQRLEASNAIDLATRAHRAALLQRIDAALDD